MRRRRLLPPLLLPALPAPLLLGCDPKKPRVPPAPPSADFGTVRPPRDVRGLADWITRSGDHLRHPFALVDKVHAQLYVFDGQARLMGATPILLGSAPGDESVPGIGSRPVAQVRPHERTTPAGRFEAKHGRNHQGEGVVWVDYDTAVSMHRVRTQVPRERRLERLASADIRDNRISYGCINVPVAFFENVVLQAFKGPHFIVYVMPETRSWQAQFLKRSA